MPIQTPCKGICKIHEEYKICLGCYRSRLQIAKWHSSTDNEKLDILSAIEIKKSIYGELDAS